jgi:hypothetical protein
MKSSLSHDELEDMIVEAVKASIPADLLRHSKNLSKEQMRIGKSTAHISGKSGAIQQNSLVADHYRHGKVNREMGSG